MIGQMVHYLFSGYNLLLIVRVLGSWVPQLANQSWMRWIGKWTDPYLDIFRKVLPPIGGTVDISPVLAFLLLYFVEQFLRSLFR